MTTINDVLGTPTIIYNKSGRVIIFLAPNAGNDFADAVEIPHLAEETYVFVNPPLDQDPINGALKFAADFDVGDKVTIHIAHTGSFKVYTNDGIDPLPQPDQNAAVQYLRVSPYTIQTWVPVS